jgi:hypothetical protein
MRKMRSILYLPDLINKINLSIGLQVFNQILQRLNLSLEQALFLALCIPRLNLRVEHSEKEEAMSPLYLVPRINCLIHSHIK